MADPTVVNESANKANTLFEQILNFFVDMGLKAAEASVGFLALPVVRQIFEWLGHQAANALALRGKQIVTKVVITAQTKEKLAEANTAGASLREALASGDQNAIKIANEEFNKKYAALTHYGGSATNAH